METCGFENRLKCVRGPVTLARKRFVVLWLVKKCVEMLYHFKIMLVRQVYGVLAINKQGTVELSGGKCNQAVHSFETRLVRQVYEVSAADKQRRVKIKLVKRRRVN